MPRVKGGVISNKRRRSILEKTKGYQFGRSKKERQAREALAHAGSHARHHRRKKKGEFRRLWQARINAAVRPHGYSYSRFMHALKQQGIGLDRKTLSQIAKDQPEAFTRIIEKLK